MRTYLLILALILVPMAVAQAQDTPPNLVGVWRGVWDEGRSITSTRDPGENEFEAELEITEQTGATFAGFHRWRHPEHITGLHDGEQETTVAEESILGVIDFDGRHIIIVDHPDTSMKFGTLINPHVMELIGAEPGPNAVVGRWILIRQ
jgi:hypothetical protein